MKWRRQAVYAALGIVLISPLTAPQLLAFPYSKTIGQHHVYSEEPIAPELDQIVARADALASRSPIADPHARQPIFLTNGGWRWSVLALRSRGALAISRPVFEVIVVNRSSQARDLVIVDRPVAPTASLARTLAHEMTHGLIRKHFGVLADWRYPTWVREGYCDYLSGGSALTDAQAKQLIAARQEYRALDYWRARKRVEAELVANGGSVDALFAASNG